MASNKGEGSKGGHITGHTKSGKPIYGDHRDTAAKVAQGKPHQGRVVSTIDLKDPGSGKEFVMSHRVRDVGVGERAIEGATVGGILGAIMSSEAAIEHGAEHGGAMGFAVAGAGALLGAGIGAASDALFGSREEDSLDIDTKEEYEKRKREEA